MSFGKRTNLTEGGATVFGVCTMMCPYTCKAMATASCRCKNHDYSSRGSSYNTNYNKVIHGQRTPNF